MADQIVTTLPNKKGKSIACGFFASIGYVFWSIGDLLARSTPTEFGNGFRIVFRAFLATIMVVGGGWFLWKAAFMPQAHINEHTGYIVGFITGSFIGIAVGFYFGGQDRNRKTEESAMMIPDDELNK